MMEHGNYALIIVIWIKTQGMIVIHGPGQMISRIV